MMENVNRCLECGGPIQARNKLHLCQRTPACHKRYVFEYERRNRAHLSALKAAWRAANRERIRKYNQDSRALVATRSRRRVTNIQTDQQVLDGRTN